MFLVLILMSYSLLETWKEGDSSTNNNNSYPVNNTQWAAFSPDESSQHENSFMYELDEEHSSSDEDVDRSSSPELAGEEGEVLLRFVMFNLGLESFTVVLSMV